MNMEDALKDALRREQPPAGFAGRVLDRAAANRRRNVARTWMAIAAMLVLCALAFAGFEQRETRRQTAARQAGRELVLALKVTGKTLHSTQQMIRRRTNGA